MAASIEMVFAGGDALGLAAFLRHLLDELHFRPCREIFEAGIDYVVARKIELTSVRGLDESLALIAQ